ncbi:MAG: BppU family phage baseplate upper protein [Pelagibacteraceae bacterium]|nr:BppU family phage baseplate upper protein [Pelagibacteraceae bacterium]
MSMNMTGRGTSFVVKAGSRATLQITIKDSGGTAKNLSNNVTYSSGKWKVWKPDGTLIIDGSITFADRANGIVTYALGNSDTVIANAGVWSGEVELKDSSSVISEQTQTFNFTIEESY